MARTTRPQTSHYDYTVVSQPLQLPATTSGLYDMLLANPQLKAETILDMWEQQSQTANSTGWFATVRTDTNQVLGVHTDHYGILQNHDIDEAIQDVIQEYNDNCERDGRQGLGEARKKFIVCRDGARVYGRYDFEAYTQSVPKVGDLSLRLTSNNSFDRSCKGNVALEVLRTICANGQKTTMKDFSLTKKHTQQVNTNFIGDALFWLGEIYFLQENYIDSSDSFNELISTYAEHSRVPDANFKLGMISLRSEDSNKAKEYFNYLINNHPDSGAGILAAEELKKFQ